MTDHLEQRLRVMFRDLYSASPDQVSAARGQRARQGRRWLAVIGSAAVVASSLAAIFVIAGRSSSGRSSQPLSSPGPPSPSTSSAPATVRLTQFHAGGASVATFGGEHLYLGTTGADGCAVTSVDKRGHESPARVVAQGACAAMAFDAGSLFVLIEPAAGGSTPPAHELLRVSGQTLGVLASSPVPDNVTPSIGFTPAVVWIAAGNQLMRFSARSLSPLSAMRYGGISITSLSGDGTGMWATGVAPDGPLSARLLHTNRSGARTTFRSLPSSSPAPAIASLPDGGALVGLGTVDGPTRRVLVTAQGKTVWSGAGASQLLFWDGNAGWAVGPGSTLDEMDATGSTLATATLNEHANALAVDDGRVFVVTPTRVLIASRG